MTRIVGGSTAVIGDYDMILLTGKYLEHAYMLNTHLPKPAHEIVIQFSEQLIDNTLFSLNQFKSIEKLFDDAKRGVAFSHNAIAMVYRDICELIDEKNGFYKMMKFLKLLNRLSQSDYQQLSSYSEKKCDDADSAFVIKVREYIDNNYSKPITSYQVASILNMDVQEFEQAITLRTGRTFYEYINEVRVNRSVYLLMNSNKSVSEISYETGFSTPSNYNRIFKKRRGCTPKEFRENYIKRNSLI